VLFRNLTIVPLARIKAAGRTRTPFRVSLIDEADDFHSIDEVASDTGVQDAIDGATTLAVPLGVNALSSVARPIHAVDTGFQDNPVNVHRTRPCDEVLEREIDLRLLRFPQDLREPSVSHNLTRLQRIWRCPAPFAWLTRCARSPFAVAAAGCVGRKALSAGKTDTL
jgi:hypothetical protein